MNEKQVQELLEICKKFGIEEIPPDIIQTWREITPKEFLGIINAVEQSTENILFHLFEELRTEEKEEEENG